MSQGGQRILIIDSKLESQHALASILTNTSPLFKIDLCSQEEFTQKISEASKNSQPYALIFLNLARLQDLDVIDMIKNIGSLDPNLQLVICTPHLDDSWEETVINLEKKDNLVILKKPFDPISVKQLAFVLVKKWQLNKESCRYRQEFNKLNKIILKEQINHEITKSKNNNFIFGLFDLHFKILNLNQSNFSEEAAALLHENICDRIQSMALDIAKAIKTDNNKLSFLISSCKSLDVLKSLAEKIITNLKNPFMIMGQEISILPYIGISVFPKDGDTADELIKNADPALHDENELAKRNLSFYKSNSDKNNLESLQMEADLHNALAKKELFISYQPQYNTASEKYTGVEALIRWKHPKKGILLPIHFIPLAEETGLIVPIGEWMLKEICAQNKAWQDLGLPLIRISVNISEYQFKQHDFLAIVNNILNQTRLDPEYLELEITESILINRQESANLISQLHAAGIRLTLDDFNASTINENHIRSIPLDRLKISRSIVQNIGVKLSDEETIQTIARVAKNLNLELIAEGVETQKQLEFLQTVHCTNIQGFYFNKPLSAHQIENLLRNPAKIELNASSFSLKLT